MRKIAFVVTVCFVLIGCADGSDKQNANGIINEEALSELLNNLNESAQGVISSVTDITSKAVEAASELTKNLTQKTGNISEGISQIADEAAKILSENIENINQIGKDILQKANDTVSKVTQNASKTAGKIVQKAGDVASVASSPLYDLENGKKVFKRCVPCHGPKANLSAVGKSQDISKWSKKSIEDALKGYKDGTYGGSTKATMTSLLKTLKPQDIVDVASYIPTLAE
ncbi:MAG: c-type cytochrome [Campylobacteraceae bacterium]|jgi:cytochrome c553|nr:c-type cytochrome [Campylobacteraceae bacterium]